MKDKPNSRNPELTQVAYLSQVLQLNPLWQSGEIVALRNRFRGVALAENALAVEEQSDPTEARAELLQQLQTLRQTFWSEPLSDLQKTLNSLKTAPFADLEAIRQRLLVVAAARPKFAPLTENRKFDSQSFQMIREILVQPPREGNAVKVEFQNKLVRGDRFRKSKKMLELLRAELPDVYELEAAWFELIRTSKHQRWTAGRELMSSSSSGSSDLTGWVSNWGGYAAFVVVFAVIRGLIEFSDGGIVRKPSPPPTYVAPIASAPALRIDPPVLPPSSITQALEEAQRKGVKGGSAPGSLPAAIDHFPPPSVPMPPVPGSSMTAPRPTPMTQEQINRRVQELIERRMKKIQRLNGPPSVAPPDVGEPSPKVP